jgi:hypothetical protein
LADIYLPFILSLIGYLFAVLVKASLDLQYGILIVRLFHWVPVRSLFRDKPPNLRGSWSHIWSFNGASHSTDVSRHDNSTLYQLGPYVSCDHYADGVLYKFFGKIRGGFIAGTWYDPKDSLGYSGAFHLRIVTEEKLIGNWIGHSVHNKPGEMNGNTWIWTKNKT